MAAFKLPAVLDSYWQVFLRNALPAVLAGIMVEEDIERAVRENPCDDKGRADD